MSRQKVIVRWIATLLVTPLLPLAAIGWWASSPDETYWQSLKAILGEVWKSKLEGDKR